MRENVRLRRQGKERTGKQHRREDSCRDFRILYHGGDHYKKRKIRKNGPAEKDLTAGTSFLLQCEAGEAARLTWRRSQDGKKLKVERASRQLDSIRSVLGICLFLS